jgi:PAS domain S-box-containing protein
MTDNGKEKAAATILIAEDEGILAEDLGLSLENLGYLVGGKVSTGREAVKLAENLRPDLILMDIKLQGDIDGIEAADQIRTSLDIPVVYLTGYGEKDALDRAKMTQPYGYLGKPCTFQELRSTIETALYKHKADKRVRESEERLQLAMEATGNGLWDWDIPTGETYYSQGYCSMLGLEPQECPEHFTGWLDLIHPEDRERAWKVNQDCIHGQAETFAVEFRLRHKDGSWRWILGRGKSVARDAEGRAIRLVGTHADITVRKKAEEDLRRSEERFRSLIDQAADAIFVHDFNGRFLDVNQQACTSLGYTRDELLSMCVTDVDPDTVPRGDSAKFWSNLPATFEARHRRKDGAIFPVEIRLGPIDYGETKVVLAVARDISDRKLAEEEIRIRDEAIKASINGIDFASPDGTRVFANDALLKMWGFHSLDEAVGLHVSELWDDTDAFSRVFAELQEKGSNVGELTARRQDGSTFDAQLSASTVFDDSGKAVCNMTSYLDITDSKKAQEELRKSNRALMALGNCSEALASIEDESQLLKEICRVVVEVAGYRLAWVGYLESDDLKTVRPVAQSGYSEGYLDKLNITSADVERGRGPVGTAIRTGMPSLVRNTCADPRFESWKTDALKRGYASCIALPLIAHGEAFGAITIYAPEPEAFDNEETRFLERLADNLSFGIGALREREKNKRAEAQIKASLIEKEVLLREIHHRVKNNLAVMQSMLRLQSRHAQSTEFAQMLEEAQNRIMSMALAHELLYQSENLAYVNVAQYVGKLVHHLVASLLEVGGRVKITNKIQNVNLGIDAAIPLGFILTELISNCLKHAYPEERCGEISVSLQTVGNKEFELKVHDDGVGMAADIDTEHPSSLGLDLVRIFVRQLNGTMEILREKGTVVRIRFREG